MQIRKNQQRNGSDAIETGRYRRVHLRYWRLFPRVSWTRFFKYFSLKLHGEMGGEYEPNSLCAMQAGIDRHLRNKDYPASILNSREFKSSRSVLEGRARHLRHLGMRKRPNKACSLSPDEVETLWRCGEFGRETPRSVLNTLFWQFGAHFGMRGRQEHHDMKVEHFVVKFDDERRECVSFAEGITKTRQSGLREKTRDAQPIMYANGSPRCPVALFKFYLSKRPVQVRYQGPFYLAAKNNVNAHDEIWYKTNLVGVNYINTIMKKMIERSPLDLEKKITNHTVRRNVIKTLKKKQVPKCDIITITGHTTAAGLDPYDSRSRGRKSVEYQEDTWGGHTRRTHQEDTRGGHTRRTHEEEDTWGGHTEEDTRKRTLEWKKKWKL